MLGCVLIANRGEIAVRIMRTAQRLGLRTVAVFSPADRDALHVRCADIALPIGASPASESYLRGELLIAAARAAGADCIHPGYGFLSENADFAEAVAAAGLIFIGPPPSAMRAMGLKDRARALMVKAGVPVTPGYHGQDQDIAALEGQARQLGFPVLVKAVAGGGGRGMRRVDDEADFAMAAGAARREAQAAFDNGDLLVERYIRDPRHIEVQVFADAHGNIVHLFERDCSLQRRYQKVLEEAPAPGLAPDVRAAMGRAAVEAARAVGYVGAGTVEFIAEGGPEGLTGQFWFMEMNTRLQVEHPVTEAITGLDLVEWQFRVASGERLPLAQAAVAVSGHAVEVRIYAEDPEAGFLPSTGRIAGFRLPTGEGLRIDAGVDLGDTVSPFYDSMIAKVVAHAPTREAAFGKLAQALAEVRIAGPRTNLAFLSALCAAPDVRAGRIDTGFIDRQAEALGVGRRAPDDEAVRLAALALLSIQPKSGPSSPWEASDGFQLGSPRRHGVRLLADSRDVEVEAEYRAPDRGGLVVRFAGGESDLAVQKEAQAQARLYSLGPSIFVLSDGRQTMVCRYEGDVASASAGLASDGILRAPMHGRLVTLAVRLGDQVAAGAVVAVVEAMKMEHSLVAPRAGKVIEVTAIEGAQVQQGAIVVRIALDKSVGDGA